MNKANIFAQLVKVDVERREVHGIACSAIPDHSGEVLDYKKSKPHFQAWSDSFAKATDGKSVGNLRAMHGNLVAGKLTSLMFNDDAEQIEVIAKVVDDNEWKKTLDGCYTGFSIGGSYVGEKWDHPVHKGKKAYEAKPSELSLVDAPCVPNATFSLVRADGSTTLQKFVTPVSTESGESGAAAKVASGDAGLETGVTNPLDKVRALRTQFVDLTATRSDPQKLVEKAVDALLKKYQAGDAAVAETVDFAMSLTGNKVEKSLWTVSSMLDALRALKCAASDVQFDVLYGDAASDASMVSKIKSIMSDVADAMIEMVKAEIGSAEDVEVVVLELSKPAGDVKKDDAAGDLKKIQPQAAAAKPGEQPSADPATTADPPASDQATLNKSLGEELTKVRSEIAALTKRVGERENEILSLRSQIKRPVGNVHAVSKSQDAGNGQGDGIVNGDSIRIPVVRDGSGNVDLGASMIKHIHAQGGVNVLQK